MGKGTKKWSRKKIITLVISLVVVLAVAVGIFLVVRQREAKSTTASAKRTTQVTRGNIEVSLSGSGTIESASTSDVMSNVQGKIIKSYKKVGDTVKKGDLLYEMDDTDAKLQIQKIQNSIEQQQLSESNTSKNYSNMTVTAPFSGKVTGVSAVKGDNVNNGMSLFTITDTSKLKLSVPLSTANIPYVKIGQSVKVNLQQFTDTISGVITEIGDNTHTASTGGMVRDVTVTVNNPGTLTDESMASSVDFKLTNGTEVSSKEESRFSYASRETVKAQAQGTLSTVNVKENQFVKKGDLLVRIENDQLQLTSKTDSLKMQDLQNQRDAAQKQLEDYKIISSIDGTVTALAYKTGDSVKSGDTLISIRDFNQMQFIIPIDELDISKIKVGQKATVTVDALPETTEQPLNGEVIGRAMEGTSSNGVATYDVTIKVNETKDLLAGMNANANIILNKSENALRIPLEAVTKMGDRSFVRVMSNGEEGQPDSESKGPEGNRSGAGEFDRSSDKNGTGGTGRARMSAGFMQNQEYYKDTVMKQIEVGLNNDEFVEIKSGLEEGEIVVLPPLVTNTVNGNTSTQGSFGLGGFGGMGGMNRAMGGNFGGGNSNRSTNRTSGSSNSGTNNSGGNAPGNNPGVNNSGGNSGSRQPMGGN
ncbi:HlyD family efflux transporter periplasmic adaptor subunit [Clostridium sp. BNL1100]|uniref:efflux RND transporter periplasmic adaptor subunit n=1 Tax=Clostridium sp. BNL1100 TaxID=755731 RepID=UPI00024A7C92|nr:HlyD family efflux transporter periplasmic adaptor subunit [Clostridium sp. BNL1100]AEY65346.1 membrane-fusion protein [Clostridium sp. BNL1100]